MSITLTRLLSRLRRAAAPPGADPDAVLLGRFARRRDEEAFAALVARHGPMVLNVCRRVLGNEADAEDAFQATFLVLARRAGSVARPAALAGWLYGVAARVAAEARRRRAGRRCPGLAAAPEPADPRPDPLAEVTARDLLVLLEDEVRRLPEVYRLPVVLCCLEGLGQEEAARRLGCSAAAVKGRLERGRARLHRTLARRGLTLSAALAVAEAGKAGAAGSPLAPLVLATTRAGLLFVSRNAPAGAASARAAALAEGVLRMLLLKRLGAVAACCLLGAALLTAGVLAYARPAAPAGGAGAVTPAPEEAAPVRPPRLWAGLSVNQPVFREGDTGALQLTFTLVNDGHEVADPKLAAAQIVVNGKALPDSGRILSNGPRDGRFTALPPGDHLLFGYALGNYFEKPGVYRVHWQGEGFRSEAVVFRVLPKEQARAKEAPQQAKADGGTKVEGFVERIADEGGTTLVLRGVGPVAVDEHTEYLAETGFDARQASLKEVLHKQVYAATEKRGGGGLYARVVVIRRFQEGP
jgi:RNA polymerase sigma factor (sigma-70 family)